MTTISKQMQSAIMTLISYVGVYLATYTGQANSVKITSIITALVLSIFHIHGNGTNSSTTNANNITAGNQTGA